MSTVVYLVLAALLGGCATQAQQRHQQLAGQFTAAADAVKTCFATLRRAPATQLLEKRFIMDTEDPDTVKKLADREYVTDTDRDTIIAFAALRRPCQKLAIEEFGKVHPEYVVSFARSFTEADADLAGAINRQLTVGDVNRRSLDRFNQMLRELTAIGQRITAELDEAHRYEMRQRQIAAQALQNWGYQQQLLNAATRPTTINCHYIGRFLNCSQF